MTKLKKVSCLMPTYARFPNHGSLVEESVESFLKQDYKNKELIILNDCPGQKLIFEHPQVSVINTNRRLRSLGEKYNVMASLASGDILCPWEDDDINLPWRISLSVKSLEKNKIDYWRPIEHWISRKNKPVQSRNNSINSQCIYTRHAFNEAKGYRHISFKEDDLFESDIIISGCKIKFEDIPIKHWFYIYRRSTGSYHISLAKNTYDDLGKLETLQGSFTLNPHWEINYEKNIKHKIKMMIKANQI